MAANSKMMTQAGRPDFPVILKTEVIRILSTWEIPIKALPSKFDLLPKFSDVDMNLEFS